MIDALAQKILETAAALSGCGAPKPPEYPLHFKAALDAGFVPSLPLDQQMRAELRLRENAPRLFPRTIHPDANEVA